MIEHPNVLMLYIEPTPYILGLIERLRERYGGEVRVLFVGANITQQWDMEVTNDQTEVLPSRRIRAQNRIRDLMNSGRYQGVHLAGWGHPLLFSTMVYARMKGLHSFVESDTPCPPSIAAWKAAVKKIIYPFVFRAPSMFLPGGKRQAQYLRDFGVRDERITIAQMTVDTVSISSYVERIAGDDRNRIRERFGIPPNADVFVYVGRMEPHKGIRILLQAFEQIHRDHSKAYLLLVGEGTLDKELMGASQSSPGVVVAGRCAGDALLDCYAASDVFVLPSLFEPWGLVVNEAMAAGLPVIVSERVGCVDDLVTDEETGLIADADSAESLLKAMRRLLSDPALRATMSSNSRKKIAGWTLESEAEIVTKTWNSVIREHKDCLG